MKIESYLIRILPATCAATAEPASSGNDPLIPKWELLEMNFVEKLLTV